MLKIEKTLKELRDLQNTLHGLGIEMSINDADVETKSDYEDAAMTNDPDDPFYRNMFNRGLIDRDGLTELGRKAMEHYVASA